MATLLVFLSIFAMWMGALMAFHNYRVHGRQWPWLVIGSAMGLIGVRFLLRHSFGNTEATSHLGIEFLRFVTSTMMLGGIYALGVMVREQRRLAEQLSINEGRLQEELQNSYFHEDNSPLAIIEWDADGRVKRWSRGAERMFGWRNEQVAGKSLFEWQFVADENHEDVQTMVARLLAGGELRNTYCCQNFTKTGGRLHCEWYNSVRADERGRVKSILSRVMDITARVNAEEGARAAKSELEQRVVERTAELREQLAEGERKQRALDATQRRFSVVFNHTLQMMAVLEPDGTTREVNQAGLAISGLSRDKVIGRNILDLLWWEVAPERVERLRQGLAAAGAGQLVRYECDVVTANQGTRMLDFSIKPVKDESGRVFCLIAEARDITDGKMQEEALVESEERFRAALENAPIGMAIVSTTGQFSKVNKSLCDIVGYSESELLGTTFQKITHPDDLDLDLDFVRRALDGEIIKYKMEKRYIHKTGTHVWVMLHISLVRDSHQKPLYFLAQIEDITERRQTAERIEEANRKLEQTVQNLEVSNRQMVLLKEMSDQLQACLNFNEAGEVITVFGRRIFECCSGAVYLYNSSRNNIERLLHWGEDVGARYFQQAECWALRRGKVHVTEIPGGLACKHLVEDELQDGKYFCVPLVAQGESLGVLQLFQATGEKAHAKPADEEMVRHLASMVSEHVSLVFGNLKLREILHAQSMRDALTGLHNRRYMEESFQREISRAIRNERPLSVVMMDIDHFKKFNDTYGHDAGDAVLKAVGEKLRSSLRSEDIVCRYGGEEFMIILPDASLESAAVRANDLRLELSRMTVSYRAAQLDHITVSMGVSSWPDHGPDTERLKKLADTALYQSKADGRNRVTIAKLNADTAKALVTAN